LSFYYKSVYNKMSGFRIYYPTLVVEVVIPEGYATSALQTTGNATLTQIENKIVECDTGAVTVVSTVFPDGASTSALQTAGNATLEQIDTKIVACNTGAVTIASSALPTGASVSGTYSTLNSTSTLLNNGQTFTGVAEDVSRYASVCMAAKTDQSGEMYAEFSSDGTNWDSVLTFTIAASTNEVHRLSVTRRYFRASFYNNSGANQTYLRLQTLFGGQTALTSLVNTTIQTDADTQLTRSIITGITDSGMYYNVPVDQSGHLQVAVHSPLLPFGSLHTENLFPVFQSDAVYGLNSFQEITNVSGSGSAVASNSAFTVSTGVTIYSLATLQSRKRLRYRPGQGIVARFAGLFSTPAEDAYQLLGVGHAEDGLYFGYQDTVFGILYVNRGVRECRTLTITVGANANGNTTVTLNDVAFSIAVTNSSNIYRTAYELSIGTYAGWETSLIAGTVIFLANSSGAKSGAYSVSGSGITGSFAQTKAGVASTDSFIPQSTWNGDKLNGSGASGITANWQTGNVFELGIQYLGFGTLTCKVETAPSNNNNPTWVVVHTIKLPNSLSNTSFRNPAFPYTMAAYSYGSTTNVSASVGSFAGFIEGQKVLTGNRFSYYAQSVLNTVGSASYFCLFTIQNMRYYQGISNQSVVNIMSISAALKHTSPCIIYLILNAILVGNPNFTQYATNSCTAWDTSATTCTFVSGTQLVWSGHMGDTGEIDHDFTSNLEDFTLQPGEYLTVATRTVTGNASYVTASLNTREDQ